MANELHYTVKPGQENLITFLGEAWGTYLLYEDDPKTHLKLFGDDAGIVRVHVKPKVGSQYAKLTLEGSSGCHYFHLRAANEANDEYPFHAPHSASLSGCDTRPALSVEEAHQLSDRELMKRGYRTRTSFGKHTDKWLQSVITPCVRIPGKTIPRHDVGIVRNVREPARSEEPSRKTAENRTSSSFAGLELVNTSDQPFGGAEAGWIVPSLGEYPAEANALIVAGMDGDFGFGEDPNIFALAGVACDYLPVPSGFGLTSVFVFTQVSPNQYGIQQVPNFPISPGDGFFFWFGFDEDEGQTAPSPSAPNLEFFFERYVDAADEGLPEYFTTVYVPRGETVFSGNLLLYGVERLTYFAPDGSRVLRPLAEFGTIAMTSLSSLTTTDNYPRDALTDDQHTQAWVTMVDQDSRFPPVCTVDVGSEAMYLNHRSPD